jgi:RNA polymerase sigma-70 factor (ECF subfamily)
VNAPDDATLAAQALAGHKTAHRALMERHRGRVHRIALAHCGGDGDAALDITQQAFIAAFAALHRYDPARPFAHWLARITLNKARDHARRMTVRRWLTLSPPAHHQPPDPAPSADTALADKQELARAMAEIARLPSLSRDVLILCGMEGMAQADVAALLGITPKAVENRLRRARETLRAALRDQVSRPVSPA